MYPNQEWGSPAASTPQAWGYAPPAPAPAQHHHQPQGGVEYGQAPWHSEQARRQWMGPPQHEMHAMHARQVAAPSMEGYGLQPDFTGQYSGFGAATQPEGAVYWRGNPKGPWNVQWQLFLMHQGISVGAAGADGDFGPATENGTKAFQIRERLPANGWVDADDIARAQQLGFGQPLPHITPAQVRPRPIDPTQPPVGGGSGGGGTPMTDTAADPSKPATGRAGVAAAVGLGLVGVALVAVGLSR